MKRYLILGSALAALTAGVVVAQQPAPRMAPQMAAQPQTGTPSLPATQKLFADYIAANKMPGIVGVIGHGDAPPAVIANGKLGDEPGAAMTDADSLWRVYSMT